VRDLKTEKAEEEKDKKYDERRVGAKSKNSTYDERRMGKKKDEEKGRRQGRRNVTMKGPRKGTKSYNDEWGMNRTTDETKHGEAAQLQSAPPFMSNLITVLLVVARRIHTGRKDAPDGAGLSLVKPAGIVGGGGWRYDVWWRCCQLMSQHAQNLSTTLLPSFPPSISSLFPWGLLTS